LAESEQRWQALTESEQRQLRQALGGLRNSSPSSYGDAPPPPGGERRRCLPPLENGPVHRHYRHYSSNPQRSHSPSCDHPSLDDADMGVSLEQHSNGHNSAVGGRYGFHDDNNDGGYSRRGGGGRSGKHRRGPPPAYDADEEEKEDDDEDEDEDEEKDEIEPSNSRGRAHTSIPPSSSPSTIRKQVSPAPDELRAKLKRGKSKSWRKLDDNEIMKAAVLAGFKRRA